MAKKVNVYSTLTETRELRLYDNVVRVLFDLPKRSGTIKGVERRGSATIITFEKSVSKCKTKKFI